MPSIVLPLHLIPSKGRISRKRNSQEVMPSLYCIEEAICHGFIYLF